MNKFLNGPSINSDPGKFDKIVIFLHGYGANGNDLISLNFGKIENSICDFFVICSGTSSTHVKAIEENVRKKVQKMTKQKPWHVEQDNKADWILMDYSDIILHIFQEETRSFYNLEELWGDAKKTSHN